MMSGGAWAWWGPGLILMALCMFMMFRMMAHGHGSPSAHTDETRGRSEGHAEGILADRLARGEIDVEEYEHRLDVIARRREAETT